MTGGAPDPALDRFLVTQGLARADEPARWSALAGGVSSDIWRIDLPDRTLCVKRALPRLKVAAEWRAPVSRNANEWAWLCFAAAHEPQAVPRPLAHDAEAGLFAMEFLATEDHPVWKRLLLDGAVDVGTAVAVGALLGRLHAASAGRADLAAAFDTLPTFHALRLEPYLLATARRRPALAALLEALAERTAATRRALVHGDVSPKNVLVGPRGPVLLDAECAWYGDPAFDVAFCLNHLLLKSLVVAAPARPALRRSFDAFVAAYFDVARFEPRADLEARAASLLPALLLARVDGKSPVEYLADRPAAQDVVRSVAAPLLHEPPSRLADVAGAWRAALAAAARRRTWVRRPSSLPQICR
ncbi:MAG TPA: aminoglycoside phosphotransferase family protein [Ideonella sp.]|nr:aminoglycoside phosphotransferase family protein [Ideonella sp.]